jgi:ribonuclease HII
MIGIDEVGRGCWAGPLLVVAARQTRVLPKGLNDSKVLSRIQRSRFMESIIASCELGEGWVQPGEIDHLGLSEAMRLGVKRALYAIDTAINEQIILDGNINYCDKKFFKASAVVKADALFPIVSAASIYAKVTRDKYMSELPERYKKYEFASHVGYGTQLHLKRLQEFGVSDLHRRSFKPLRQIL